MTIDWNGKLEVVERDGSVHPATLTTRDEVFGGGYAYVSWRDGERNHWFERDGVSNVGVPDVVRNVVEEQKEDGMTTFKVGDRVRVKDGDYWCGIVGVYDGRDKDSNGWATWDYFIPDHDQRFHDGARCGYGGKRAGMALDAFELIAPATDELAELRAWKDAAIAKHPDLAPTDPDLLAARNVFKLALEDCGYAEANPKVMEGFDRGNQDDAPPVVE